MKQKEDLPSLNVYNSATQIEQFLNAVLGPGFGGFIELRMIRGKRVKQFFYPESREVITDLFVRRAYLANEWNIYFGVCPWKQKKGREENVSSVRVLWADIDPKKR